MYSNGYRFPIDISLSKSEYELLNEARLARGRSLTGVVTTIVRNATTDFTDFSIVDQPLYAATRGGVQSFKKVAVQCNWGQHKQIHDAASSRTRSMASLIRTIIYQSTKGMTDFSIVDSVLSQGGSNARSKS